jgi:hypothetical protein
MGAAGSGPAAGRSEMARAAALFAEGRHDEAREIAQRIVAADARNFHALHLLAVISARRGEWDEALALGTRAIEIDPGNAEALANRGAALRAMHRFDEALADYDRALAIAPSSPAVHNNRAVALAALHRHREAIAAFDAALRLRPDYPQARYGRGISRLVQGDFAGGWEDHEWRWLGSENPGAARRFDVPAFSAQDWPRARRVALWSEQGIGDQLIFTSLVPDLEGRGMGFVLEADPRLIPALARAHPAWELAARPAPDAAFAACDRHLPLGSLPRLLRPDGASFRSQPRQLLAADPVRAARCREALGGQPGMVIGISWRSFQPAARSFYERRKNAPLESFLALSNRPGVRLVDLQYGDTAAERDAFAAAGGRLWSDPALDRFGDLDGLLALIAACDLVVSTSNVTAHLAGALGKRTLLAFPAATPPFHYWAADAAGRSPWYPSVEIVTDAAARGWNDVMDLVVGRL